MSPQYGFEARDRERADTRYGSPLIATPRVIARPRPKNSPCPFFIAAELKPSKIIFALY